jgi:hypothetical protein
MIVRPSGDGYLIVENRPKPKRSAVDNRDLYLARQRHQRRCCSGLKTNFTAHATSSTAVFHELVEFTKHPLTPLTKL